MPNPDKSDERDSDLMLNTPTSNYYSIPKFNQLLDTSGQNSITLFHCNIRSLPKNLTLLNDILYSLNSRPDVLAITETKLNSQTITNIDIPSYNLFHTDSQTMAGGAGLYISKDLQTIHRPDLKFTIPLVESCWSENVTSNGKSNIIIGCIYRHPTANLSEFTPELENLLKQLNQKNYQVYIMGDMNIDFLKYSEHAKTEEYLNMLYSNSLLPLPDHLPVFCICNTQLIG